jgi:hypothetical protein
MQFACFQTWNIIFEIDWWIWCESVESRDSNCEAYKVFTQDFSRLGLKIVLAEWQRKSG